MDQILLGQYSGLNPPLYFAILRLILRLFGETEIVMRGFSVALGMLSLSLFYLLARRTLKSFVAAVAALILMATHPLFINYSTEIRPYSLLILLSLLCYLSYLRLQDNAIKYRNIWASMLTLCLIGCLNTHHFGALIWLSLFIHYLVNGFLNRKQDKPDRLILGCFGLSAIAYFYGLEILRRQLLAYFTDISRMNSPAEFLQIFTFSFHLTEFEPLLAAIAIAAFCLGTIVLLSRHETRQIGRLIIIAILASSLAVLLAYWADINIVKRYLVGIAPLTLIAIAGTLTAAGKRWIRILINAVGIVVIALYIVQGIDFALSAPRENSLLSAKADWRGMAEVIQDLKLEEEQIVITAWDMTPLQYYLGEEALTISDLEKEMSLSQYSSYLIITSSLSGKVPILDQAALLYENQVESVKVFRLTIRPKVLVVMADDYSFPGNPICDGQYPAGCLREDGADGNQPKEGFDIPGIQNLGTETDFLATYDQGGLR